MASHTLIMRTEDCLIETRREVVAIAEAYRNEKEREGGKPQPKNRDCWGTLYLNASALRNQLNALLHEMEKDFNPY
jgi:hypothetical protein